MSSLINDDLKPTTEAQRTWRWYHFTALWIGMVMCIPTYTLAASLIDSGMSWSQAVGTVFLGNAIVLVPMLLIGHAGAKYGIPYAVLARASFGTIGARLPALLRAAGCVDVRVRVVQPAALEGDVKRMAPLTLANIADAVLAAGLADGDELARLQAELDAQAADPDALASLPRIVQAWGRRAA